MKQGKDPRQVWLVCLGWVWLLVAARIGFVGALQAATDLAAVARSSGGSSFDPSNLGLLAPIALFLGNNYVVVGAVKALWGVLGVCLAVAYLAKMPWGQGLLLRWAVVSTGAFAVVIGYRVALWFLAPTVQSSIGSVMPGFLLTSSLSVVIGVLLVRLLDSSCEPVVL